jgi:hypothetical protein
LDRSRAVRRDIRGSGGSDTIGRLEILQLQGDALLRKALVVGSEEVEVEHEVADDRRLREKAQSRHIVKRQNPKPPVRHSGGQPHARRDIADQDERAGAAGLRQLRS